MRPGRHDRSPDTPPGTLARPLSLLLVGAFAFAPSGALADEPRADALHYETPPECPASREWTAQLYQRLPASPSSHAAANALRVHIERRPTKTNTGDYHGVVRAAGTEEARAVDGTSCREVFEALVLVAVLSLGADPGEPSDDAASHPTSSPAGNAASEFARTEPTSLADQPPAAEGSQRRANLRWGAAGLVLVQSAIAPNPSLDVGAGLIARWSLAGFEPWLLVGVYTAAASQTARVENAAARFEHTALRAVGCPWRFPGPGWLALRPCLGLDVGQTRGEGLGISRSSSNSSAWLAARGELRLEFSIYDGLSAGGAGGAALPLIRPRFYFEPDAVVFETPAWGLEGSAFVAWLFDG